MVRSVTESEVERNQRLIERLERAWKRSDALFDMVRETSVREQPVELRHPVIFYLGHVSASAWNHYGRPVLERESPRPEFDGLFDDERGVTSAMAPGDWPSVSEVRGYRDGIRSLFRSGAEDLARRSADHPLASEGRVFRRVLEHELSHQELLLNLFQELDLSYKKRPHWWSAPRVGAAQVEPGFVTLPGFTTPKGEEGAFELGRTPVTIGEFEGFVDDDGYEDPRFWTPAGWAWLESGSQVLPKDWVVRNGRRYVRTMFDRIALEEVSGWPVSVAPAEAQAYARWKGARLPEPQELLAAAQPRSDSAEDPASPGNYGFLSGSPTPVGTFPEGATPEGVHDLLGNGWDLAGNESTTTLFGGSWATDAVLVQAAPSRDYDVDEPVPFTQFRLARNAR